MSCALEGKGGDLMSSFDLIWNLVMMLIDQIKDSNNEKNTNDKND